MAPAGDEAKFTIEEDGDKLIFTTAYFSPDAGSVLHSGIYNREFSSMLASMAAAGLSYPLFAVLTGDPFVLYGALLLVAAATFPLFRKYVFRERLFKAVFDSASGRAVFFHSGLTSGKTDSFSLSVIDKLLIEKKIPEIKNPDGVEFVKKISLQHNAIIPGFGDETPLFLLKLDLTDGTDRILYSDRSMANVLAAYDRINGFLIKNNRDMRG